MWLSLGLAVFGTHKIRLFHLQKNPVENKDLGIENRYTSDTPHFQNAFILGNEDLWVKGGTSCNFIYKELGVDRNIYIYVTVLFSRVAVQSSNIPAPL